MYGPRGPVYESVPECHRTVMIVPVHVRLWRRSLYVSARLRAPSQNMLDARAVLFRPNKIEVMKLSAKVGYTDAIMIRISLCNFKEVIRRQTTKRGLRPVISTGTHMGGYLTLSIRAIRESINLQRYE